MTTDRLGPRQVAQLTGVSTDTLRHYERLGLLKGVERTLGGYRRYPPNTVDRVLLIQRALVVGFSLGDLKKVLTQRDRGGVPCQGVRALVGQRLESLQERISELQALEVELSALLGDWDARLSQTPTGQPARLLETLGSRGTVERQRQRRSHGRPQRDFK